MTVDLDDQFIQRIKEDQETVNFFITEENYLTKEYTNAAVEITEKILSEELHNILVNLAQF